MIKIYYHLPDVLKNIVVSSTAFIKARQKYGEIYNATYKFLYSTDINEQKVQADKELHIFLENIKKNNNFYAIPNDLDIYKIPIIDKETVIKNYSRIISGKPFFIAKTSGTTGQPLAVPYSREAYQREYAFWWYHRSFGNIKRGDKVATFAGHKVCDVNKDSPPFWAYNYFENQLIFSSYHLSKKNIGFYIKKLNDFKPVLIHGYPSSIYLIAHYILENSIKLDFTPKMIITASETLLDFQRDAIEKAFGCKCYIWYGNTELCGHITECIYGKLHIQPYHSFVRIVNNNGEDVSSGEEGFLVGTNFSNYIFPLINYNTKDVVKLSQLQDCKCLKGGQIIDYIIGRVEDYIVLPNGRWIGRLDHLFKSARYVRNAQIEQKKLGEIIIRIEREPGYSTETEKKILEEARGRLGSEVAITFDYVNEIPKDKNGKFKFIVQNMHFKMRGNYETNYSKL